jgi:hypothetical protein
METTVNQVTAEQIAIWKKQHSDVFELNVDGHKAYLKKPTRQDISFATAAAVDGPLKFNEALLNACWLGGDEAIKTDDDLFISAGKVVGKLVTVKSAELVKL